MSVRLHLKNLRPGLDALGFLVDLVMIVLVIVNLTLILFDWLYRVESVQVLLHAWMPGFFTFYRDQIHANFFEIDLAFVSVYLTEFVVCWIIAIVRRSYHRWFFYPFVHWYDLLGCIPVGSFRWLRILRVVNLMFRLQKLGVVDFSDTYLGRTVIKYYKVLMEEISDRVVINILEGVQREIRTGGPMMQRIEQQVLAPRRDHLVDYVADRIVSTAQRTHESYRHELDEYLLHLTEEAVTRTAAGQRLARIPVAGPRAIALLGDTVRETGGALIDQLVEDIASPAHRARLDALIDGIISASGGGGEQLNEMVRETLLEVLEHVKIQVAVQHWKKEEEMRAGHLPRPTHPQ